MILQFDVPFFLLYLTSFLSYTHLPIYLPLNGIIVKEERAWKAFIYRPSLLGRILKDLSLSFCVASTVLVVIICATWHVLHLLKAALGGSGTHARGSS